MRICSGFQGRAHRPSARAVPYSGAVIRVDICSLLLQHGRVERSLRLYLLRQYGFHGIQEYLCL